MSGVNRPEKSPSVPSDLRSPLIPDETSRTVDRLARRVIEVSNPPAVRSLRSGTASSSSTRDPSVQEIVKQSLPLTTEHIEVQIDRRESIAERYLEEVKSHIAEDIDLIKKQLLGSRAIKHIKMSRLGSETHCGGKVPLLLTFELEGELSIEFVYKPRSVMPEKRLQELAFLLNRESGLLESPHHRQILACNGHGYDSFIRAEKLFGAGTLLRRIPSPGKFVETIYKLAEKRVENRNLIFALSLLKIEDIHFENFLVDKAGFLYFIDAEVYQTNIAQSVEPIISRVESTSSSDDGRAPSKSIFEGVEISEGIKALTERYLEELRRIPTRLLLCNTQSYLRTELLPGMVRIELFAISGILGADDRESLVKSHLAQLARFLHKKEVLRIDKNFDLTIKEDYDEFKILINNAFILKGVPVEDLIEQELRACQGGGEGRSRFEDVPFFLFDLSTNMLKFPLTKASLMLKRES